MPRDFILDEKNVEFPTRVTFNEGMLSLYEEEDEDGVAFYKVLRFVEQDGNMVRDDTYYFTKSQLRCLFYLLSV